MGTLCSKKQLEVEVDDDIAPIEVYTQTGFPMNDKQDTEKNEDSADPRGSFISSAKYTIDDFDRIALLGKGTFGKVMLVKNKATSKYYAMKILSKKTIRERGQELHTIDERLLLQRINHPFIVNLHYAFQDADFLFLLLDFAQGGELFYHLHRESFFSNERMKFYAAELILALDHLHSNGYIYRDIKPENILIDKDGHIKLTDFGLSKRLKQIKGKDEKAFTICGTFDYLAPEILSDNGYDMSVDWWSLGALMYEMLAGYSPFKQKTKKFNRAVWNKEIPMLNHFTEEAKDIISKFLVVDPKQRLGSGPNGIKQIKTHPFFSDINWCSLENKRIKPPYLPRIRNNEDVSNFDKFFTNESVKELGDDPVDTQSGKDIYKGFSYMGDLEEGDY